MQPELRLCSATEVALHGDARILGGLPSQRAVGECVLDGTRGQRVHLEEVIEDSSVTALTVGTAAGVVGCSGGILVRLVQAQLGL